MQQTWILLVKTQSHELRSVHHGPGVGGTSFEYCGLQGATAMGNHF